MSDNLITSMKVPKGNNELTPTDLAREMDINRRDVMKLCMNLGVPIFQGRINTKALRIAMGGPAELNI